MMHHDKFFSILAILAVTVLLGLLVGGANASVAVTKTVSGINQLAWSYVAQSGTNCKPEHVRRLVRHGAEVNYENDSSSLLNQAITVGANLCAVELLKLGAIDGVKKPDSLGTYSINAASSSSTCDEMILNALLSRGASVSSRGLGGPPLVEAAFAKNVQCVSFLIRHGAQLNAYGGSRAITPLMAAQLPAPNSSSTKAALRATVTKMLISAGAGVNILQSRGQTALFLAAGLGKSIVPCSMCVKILLAAGANPNVIDDLGQTPLLWALSPRRETTLAVIKELITGGADVNLANPKTGETPLMAAVLKGDEKIVCYLLEHGANRSTKDNEGQTAVDYARRTHHEQIVELVRG